MIEPQIIIGVDEAGRGALAGPLVVAATAFLRTDCAPTATYHSLRGGDKIVTAADSKSFTNATHREVLDSAIRNMALAVAVVERSAKDIDARLMYAVFPETTKLAISRVLEQLQMSRPDAVPSDYLVMLDGEMQPPAGIPCPVRCIVNGDKLVWQIGAASIVAKVHRDARMLEIHEQYPNWAFDQHKGYPVPAHKKLLKLYGPTPVHRRTFRPVAEAKGLPPGFEE